MPSSGLHLRIQRIAFVTALTTSPPNFTGNAPDLKKIYPHGELYGGGDLAQIVVTTNTE
jgi:hypothetical protein